MKRKGFLTLVLAASLAVSMAPLSAGTVRAEESGQDSPVPAGESGIQEEDPDGTGTADSEEMLDGYVEEILGMDSRIALFAAWGERALGESEKEVYRAVKSRAEEVAAEGGSTEDMLSGGTAVLSWTYEELGISGSSDPKCRESALNAMKHSMRKVMDVLTTDCPYELYWYDKTESGGWKYYYSGLECTEEGVRVTVSGISFTVAQGYRLNGDPYCVDASRAQAAVKAVQTAARIRDRYSGASDYEKLEGYKNEICALADYNSEAASDPTAPYGDPWQIIYVFDGDPSTRVVCEGYAKAFQYLCDMTEFLSPDIACYTVTGTMGGPHMWNIVTMPDGGRYLADLTNSDEGMSGQDGSLFLAGYREKLENGYLVGSNRYYYDENTRNIYGTGEDSILNLSQADRGTEQQGGGRPDGGQPQTGTDHGTGSQSDVIPDPETIPEKNGVGEISGQKQERSDQSGTSVSGTSVSHTSGSGTGKTEAVQTGDSENPAIWIFLLAVSGAAGAGTLLAGRRRRK